MPASEDYQAGTVRTADPQLPLFETLARYRLALVREPDPPPWLDLDRNGQPLSGPATVAGWLALRMETEPAEVMGAVYVDTRNRPIAWAILFRGTLSRAAVEPRQVLATGLLCNAAGLILWHNHPSGDPDPSQEDLAFTRRMAEAGELVGVRLVDHLILGSGRRWVSLRQRGAW